MNLKNVELSRIERLNLILFGLEQINVESTAIARQNACKLTCVTEIGAISQSA